MARMDWKYLELQIIWMIVTINYKMGWRNASLSSVTSCIVLIWKFLHPKKREAIIQTTLNKLFNIHSPPIIVNDERIRAKETTSERSKSTEYKHTGSQLTLETAKSNVSSKNSLVQPNEDNILTRQSYFMVISKQIRIDLFFSKEYWVLSFPVCRYHGIKVTRDWRGL